MTDLLATFGGWPMTRRRWNEASFDWKDASATARKLYDVSLLVNVYNSLDAEDTERGAIYVFDINLISIKGADQKITSILSYLLLELYQNIF